MSQIIRISKVGFNAGTETSPDNLTYSSDYNTLKYYSSGTMQIVCAGTTKYGTISHNLGYVPFFAVYSESVTAPASGYSMLPLTFNDAGFYAYINAYSGTANIVIKIDTNSLTGTQLFKYFIFRNNLGL